MIRTNSKANLMEQFDVWCKEQLNLKLKTPQIDQFAEGNRVICKLLSYTMTRAKSRNKVHKQLNHIKFNQQYDEINENNDFFSQEEQRLMDGNELVDERKMKMLRKLFLLVTQSEVYQSLLHYQQHADPKLELVKLSTLMHTTQKFINNIDSLDQLVKTDTDFNMHYLTVETDPRNSDKTFEQIAREIDTTMQHISVSLSRIFQANTQPLLHLPDTDATIELAQIQNLSMQDRWTTLQTTFNKWVALCNEMDDYFYIRCPK